MCKSLGWSLKPLVSTCDIKNFSPIIKNTLFKAATKRDQSARRNLCWRFYPSFKCCRVSRVALTLKPFKRDDNVSDVAFYDPFEFYWSSLETSHTLRDVKQCQWFSESKENGLFAFHKLFTDDKRRKLSSRVKGSLILLLMCQLMIWISSRFGVVIAWGLKLI